VAKDDDPYAAWIAEEVWMLRNYGQAKKSIVCVAATLTDGG
jgi:hypothetical protein